MGSRAKENGANRNGAPVCARTGEILVVRSLALARVGMTFHVVHWKSRKARSLNHKGHEVSRRKAEYQVHLRVTSCLGGSTRHLFESLDGGSFVVFHIENGVELGDLQQIMHFLGEVQQLEFAALIAHGGEGAD